MRKGLFIQVIVALLSHVRIAQEPLVSISNSVSAKVLFDKIHVARGFEVDSRFLVDVSLNLQKQR